MQHCGVQVGAVIGHRVGRNGRIPPFPQDFITDGLSGSRPIGMRHPTMQTRRADSTIQGDPTHDLAVDMVPGRFAGLPDSMVRLVPSGDDGVGHLLHEEPVVIRQETPPFRQVMDQFRNGTEDVQLNLVVSRVADPDRARTGIPRQAVHNCFGGKRRPRHRVQRVQPFGPRGVLQDPPQPAEEALRFLRGPEAHQRIHGHRGITEPAVAVVPVPRAADPLRKRRGGRGKDSPGGLVDQGLQNERRASHQ